MDHELIAAINATADTSYDVSKVTPSENKTANRLKTAVPKPNIAKRPSGSATTGFYRPGERGKDGAPFEIIAPTCPPWARPSGRISTNEEKRGAWPVQDAYMAGRLGEDEAENGRLWNTAKWILRHYHNATMSPEAIDSMNLYVDNVNDIEDVRGPRDEVPEDQRNEGFGCVRNIINPADKKRLELKASDYELSRLVDELEATDTAAKLDENELMRKGTPPPPQLDFPDMDQRIESGKIIRILTKEMRTLWNPVIRAIADGVTMSSLGRSQGVGDDKAATVGRWRTIEGLRLADSIRRGLERQALTVARRRPSKVLPANDNVAAPLPVPKPVRALDGHYLNQAAGPVIKRDDKRLAHKDNHRSDPIGLIAAA